MLCYTFSSHGHDGVMKINQLFYLLSLLLQPALAYHLWTSLSFQIFESFAADKHSLYYDGKRTGDNSTERPVNVATLRKNPGISAANFLRRLTPASRCLSVPGILWREHVWIIAYQMKRKHTWTITPYLEIGSPHHQAYRALSKPPVHRYVISLRRRIFELSSSAPFVSKWTHSRTEDEK